MARGTEPAVAGIQPALLALWLLRSRKGPDITVSAGGMEGLGIDVVRRWQREFQQDFCGHCVRFDRGAWQDRRTGRPWLCEAHWTDIVGVCWNFRERGTAGASGRSWPVFMTEPGAAFKRKGRRPQQQAPRRPGALLRGHIPSNHSLGGSSGMKSHQATGVAVSESAAR